MSFFHLRLLILVVLLLGSLTLSLASTNDDMTLPDELELRCAGQFVKAIGNEPTVPIRYCGDAFVVPSSQLETFKERATKVRKREFLATFSFC